ncbi:ricin-type beta-trefoil lectin domain protein [Micrococcales bacterium 31B]|nr:ricin-type beta-trefoil lectin domain protein [Micrococcales bacterium 31B]
MKRSERNLAASSRPPRRALVSALGIATLVVGLTAGSTAWSYFSDNARAQGSVTTPVIRVGQSKFPQFTTIFNNSYLTHISWFQAVNPSAQAFPATVTATGLDTTTARLPVTFWQVSSPSQCTPAATVGPGAVTGTWASLTLATRQTISGGGGSIPFCARTTVPDRQTLATPDGSSFKAPVRLRVELHDTGWRDSFTTVDANFGSGYIYPADTTTVVADRSSKFLVLSHGSECFEPYGGNFSANNYTIAWYCTQASEQRWMFQPRDPANTFLGTLRLQRNLTLSLTEPAADSVMLLANHDPSDKRQQWRLQRIDATHNRIVNNETGQCLAMWVRDSKLTTRPCNETHFTSITLTRQPLRLVNSSGSHTGLSNFTGTITFNSPRVAPQTRARAQQNVNGAWVNVSSSVPNSQVDGLVIDARGLGNGRRELRIVDSQGTPMFWGLFVDVTQPDALGQGGSLTPAGGWDPN